MFEYFRFSLPRAVTEQLVERLDQLVSSPLTDEALTQLGQFQEAHESARGVYVIYQVAAAVYAGKADTLAERLGEHLWKLRGRQNIIIGEIGFKALILDESWSTSANEDLLIRHFRERGECRWKNSGFGPKDPGKNRDGSRPSWFDQEYPIRDNFPVMIAIDELSVGRLLAELKRQVPYLFRYGIDADLANRAVNLEGIPRRARDLALHAARTLGAGWQLMLFQNGLTLYRTNKTYEHGTQLFP